MPQNNQSGTRHTATPASAGSQTTDTSVQPSGGSHEPGMSPRSALAAALVRTFGDQLQSSSIAQGTPASQAGQDPPEPADAPGDTPANSNVPAETPTVIDDQVPPDPAADPAAADPNSPEPGDQTPPADETPADQAPADEPGEEVPIGVQKRIGKLLARLAEVEDKLAAQTNPATTPETATEPANRAPATPGPLDSVTDPAELESRERTGNEALIEVENMLARLPVNPTQVARQLKAAGVTLTDENGQEDYSNERMLDTLTNLRTNFHRELRAIPKRRAYLAEYAVQHEQAVKLFPWIAQKGDQRNALMSHFLSQAPSLRAAPNHEYWVACAVRGHLATQEEMTKAGKANGHLNPNGTPKVKPRPTPGTGASPAGAPRRTTNQVKAEAARERVKREGSKAALAEFLQSTNYV